MTKRLAKRHQYEQLERTLRHLDRRRNTLYKERYFYVELEKPLFDGYQKRFILRDDLKGRPDFAILQKMLPLIDKVLFCKDKAFLEQAVRKYRKRKDRKKKVPKPFLPKDLQPYQWERLTDREKTYFTRIENFNFGKISVVYRWNFPWMLVPVIEKHYATKLRVENLNAKSEIAEINDYIERRGWGLILSRLIYGKSNNWWREDDYRKKLQDEHFIEEMRHYRTFKIDPSDDDTPPQYFDDFSGSCNKKSEGFDQSPSDFFMYSIVLKIF